MALPHPSSTDIGDAAGLRMVVVVAFPRLPSRRFFSAGLAFGCIPQPLSPSMFVDSLGGQTHFLVQCVVVPPKPSWAWW